MSKPLIVNEEWAKKVRGMSESERKKVIEFLTKMLNAFYLDDIEFDAETHFGLSFENGMILCSENEELPTGEDNPGDPVKRIYLTEEGCLIAVLIDEHERETLVELASPEELYGEKQLWNVIVYDESGRLYAVPVIAASRTEAEGIGIRQVSEQQEISIDELEAHYELTSSITFAVDGNGKILSIQLE